MCCFISHSSIFQIPFVKPTSILRLKKWHTLVLHTGRLHNFFLCNIDVRLFSLIIKMPAQWHAFKRKLRETFEEDCFNGFSVGILNIWMVLLQVLNLECLIYLPHQKQVLNHNCEYFLKTWSNKFWNCLSFFLLKPWIMKS